MNCETIDSILDDHLVARLTGAERQRAAEHMIGCARCSRAWATDDALRGEAIADPEPEAFPALLRLVAAAPAQREAAARSRRWLLAGAVAAVAISAVVTSLLVIEPAVFFTADRNSLSVRLHRALSAAPAMSPPLVPGRDYEVLPGAAARPLAAAAAATDEIEVAEFFMFACFPCYEFESELARWDAQKPSDVALTRVPAMFKPEAELHARAYYTAEVLGTLDAMHSAMYDEIHVRGNRLASRAALAELFARFGVDAATFDAAFDSRAVEARVEHAVALNRAYRITSAPTLVVDGRYSTRMLEVVDRLIAESRAGPQR